MANISFAGETAENYQQKCLCVLVLDTSGSMGEIVDSTGSRPTGRKQVIDGVEYDIVQGGISRLKNLQKGLESFYEDISNDDSMSQRLEVAVISFNDEVEIVQDPCLIEDCPPPLLSAKGMTDIAGAMETAMDVVEARKSWYRTTGQPYYRPWIILMTDGEANRGQDMDALGATIRNEVANKHFEFLPIGVDNANMGMLKKLEANLEAKSLKGTKFSQFFKWLSASMSTVVGNKEPNYDDFIEKMGSYEL